jgi:hypothetical protein
MISKGVPDPIVDFWLGHEIREMAEAYKRPKFEKLKRMYLERESFMSITVSEGLEERIKMEMRREHQ